MGKKRSNRRNHNTEMLGTGGGAGVGWEGAGKWWELQAWVWPTLAWVLAPARPWARSLSLFGCKSTRPLLFLAPFWTSGSQTRRLPGKIPFRFSKAQGNEEVLRMLAERDRLPGAGLGQAHFRYLKWVLGGFSLGLGLQGPP